MFRGRWSQKKKLKLKTINVSDNGEIDLNHFKSIINEKTKLVSVVYISNTLGTINPVKKIIEICKENNILNLIDGAQASAHSEIDVQDLGSDFLFSQLIRCMVQLASVLFMVEKIY